MGQITTWDEFPTVEYVPGVFRQTVSGEKVMMTRIVYRGGVVIPEHSHPAEQVMLVEQGRLWAKVGDEESEVGPGSLLIIPSDWVHAFRQLSDEDVVFYECFAPIRLEYLVGFKGPDRSLAMMRRRCGRPDSRGRARVDVRVRRSGILDNRSNTRDAPRRSPMTQLDIFSLDGRVALVPGGGGGDRVGAGRGARGRRGKVAVAGRTRGGLRGRRRARPGGRLRGPRDHGRRDRRGRLRPDGRRDASSGSAGSTSSSTPSAAAPARPSIRPRTTRARDWDWIMELNVRSTLLPTQAAVRAMIAAGPRRRGPQHLVGAGEPRHQRRLLGVRRGQGRDQLADPPVGDRVGQARHPGQRDHADLRRHAPGRDAARRPGLQGRASSAASRSAASARPRPRRRRRSSCARTPRRSSPARSSGIDGGLTATQ